MGSSKLGSGAGNDSDSNNSDSNDSDFHDAESCIHVESSQGEGAESECSPPDKILRLRDRIEVSRYSTGFVRLAPLFDDKFSEAPLSDSSYGSTHDHSSDIDSSCIDSSWVGAHSEVRLTPTLGSFHGVRHLSPQRPRASFVDSHRSALKSQLESLRSINRKAELKPPFVHRPNSRYLSSVLVVGDAKHESLLGDEA